MTMIAQWMQGLVNYVRAAEPDLTNRQLAVLLLVHYTSGPHTVRGLAEALAVSKPVITRALDKLANLGFLARQADEADGRNVFIVGTSRGGAFLAKFEDYFGNNAAERSAFARDNGIIVHH
ncbi:MarR family transcriptional regulator [Alterisphingorhabdus coralli]|uniref:MarR family transcriptional regulator n=1 Tax=Alterisphingorhabdus coralli TaxID=3071408 RepID=A0AA97I0L6_9SPHN|nr:MarR family transcriptional regulator [Parasphingorhabdus sp. SCSIO 66989]WOE74493.1 MarR family transcriptional regulator [Parasphingorhabdus sp. SCSIO 66989]